MTKREREAANWLVDHMAALRLQLKQKAILIETFQYMVFLYKYAFLLLNIYFCSSPNTN